MFALSRGNRSKGWYEIEEERFEKLKDELKRESKNHILNVNEADYKQYLFEKFKFSPLVMHDDTVQNQKPEQKEHNINEEDRDRYWRSRYYWECSITCQVEGSADLWDIITWRTDYSIYGSILTSRFTIQSRDVEEYNRERQGVLSTLKGHIESINTQVASFNANLPIRIGRDFTDLKAEYLRENDFFAAINVTHNPDAPRTYSVPKIEKRPAIQKPTVTTKAYAPEPTVDGKAYHDIIDCLTRVGLSIERKPSLYVGKDEEALRDLFLMQLELAFVGGTATGETFNRSGKTDILLKNTDGTNLFVGECKVWKGQKHYLEALSQLLEYLTWDDSKTALLVFVKNPTLTAVIETVRQVTLSHPSAIRFVSNRNERFLQFKFKLPQDSQKHVAIEVMLFHFDKEAEGRG